MKADAGNNIDQQAHRYHPPLMHPEYFHIDGDDMSTYQDRPVITR